MTEAAAAWIVAAAAVIVAAGVAVWSRRTAQAAARTIAEHRLAADVARRAEETTAKQMADAEQRLAIQTAALAEARGEVEEAHTAAKAAKDATRDFLANMSHEIRTPMNGVLGMLELAMDTNLSAAQREYSQTALTSAESLLGIINDILDFSHIDAGRLELRGGDFDLRERLAEVIATLAQRGHDKGLAVTMAVDADVPNRMHGDLGRLRQVLVNLAGNAIKFTERGAVTVHVGLMARSGDSTTLHFSVKDTGPGIAAEKQRIIFEAFRQADSAGTRQFDGLGLGLTISSALVERMGGQLWLESAPGDGSIFHFTATLTAGTTAPDARSAPPAISTTSRPSIPSGVDLIEIDGAASRRDSTDTVMASPLRVLLVEDNAVNQKLMRSLLSREGHAVTLAVNGRDAVELAVQTDFDLILMDLQMPVMGGIDATRMIREWEEKVGGHVPIVALTARTVEGGREACLDAGMNGYLSKPVRSEELFTTINRLVGSKTVVVEMPAAAQPMPDDLFDEAELLRTLHGDRSLLNELSALFLADAPKQVASMRDALARGDVGALKFAAHALKGSAGTLTARRIAKEARTLELLAGTDEWSSGAARPLADLELALQALSRRLAHTPGT